jgi:hypothetical protein
LIALVVLHYSPSSLWEEYQNGIGHQKAVRLFNAQEHGHVHIKHKYHHHKIVWDILSLLVNANVHFEEACECIYAAYAGKSLTAITSSIKKDKKNNTLPVSFDSWPALPVVILHLTLYILSTH